jgi:hypothetical protein
MAKGGWIIAFHLLGVLLNANGEVITGRFSYMGSADSHEGGMHEGVFP